MPLSAFEIANRLIEGGFPTFIVGGAVRDFLLNKSPHDIDLATKATPAEVLRLFPNEHVKTVGVTFGVTLINDIEVATFRTEKCFGESDKNVTVTFAATIEDDLSRRDLTINAMAMHSISKSIVDPFNGQRDLANGIIRFVGNPFERITEDPNRILRAARFFASLECKEFNFDTLAALQGSSFMADLIAKERIRIEVLKAMQAKNPSRFFAALKTIGILDKIFPSLDSTFNHNHGTHHIEDIFSHSMMTGDLLPVKFPLLRLAGFLHDVGKPLSAKETENKGLTFHAHHDIGADLLQDELTALKFTNKEITTIIGFVRNHMRLQRIDTEMSPKAIRRLAKECIDLNINLSDMVRLFVADSNARLGVSPLSFGELLSITRTIKQSIKGSKQGFSVKDLAINGNEIMTLTRLKPCKRIGEILNTLLEMVLDNPELNTKGTLTEIVKQRSV